MCTQHRLPVALAIAMLSWPAVGYAQTSPPKATSPWDWFQYFVGKWQGTGTGQPGNSKLEREYRFVLGGKFLQVTHRSTYAPQEKNPKGEVHEDIGFISYDRARHRFVMRQFHVEGFVNQYVADSLATAADSLAFTSEGIENIPAGWRARESYRLLSREEFVERFELAGPSEDFQVYSENRFQRRR